MSSKSIRQGLIAIIILGLPFAFFFYYKQKINQLPHIADSIPVYWPAPSFKYQTQNGDTLSSDSLKGYLYVADFIYTSCGSICPDLSQKMSEVQLNFKDNARVKLVSFSIDPQNDSLPVLKDYAARFGAIKNKWYFLRGEEHTVWNMAEQGFKLPVVANDTASNVMNKFIHTGRIVLVDEKGQVRGMYNALQRDEMDSLYNSMAQLLMSNQ